MIREKIRKKEIEEKLQKEHAELKLAEKATNLAHTKFKQIFNGTTDGMRVIDKDFNVLRVNETFSALSGISKDESVGKKCYEVLYGSLCHIPSCPLTRILCGEERVEAEVEKERKDGIRIHCILTATPFRNPDGELIGIVEDFKEITGSKRAEEALRESEEKYRILAESSLTGIFIHQDGKYVFVNDRFAEIHGYTPEELLGKEYWTLIHPDEREALREIVSKRLKGEFVPQRYEVRRLKKDGETIYCETMAALIEYKGRPAVMGNIIDITEHKKAEEALQESKKKLRFLSSHLLTAQERERRRISIELHDELGQALMLLKLKLRSIERNLRIDQTEVRQDCEDTLLYIDQVIKNVRRLSHDLSPSILEDLGLLAAIRWLIDDCSKYYNIKTSLDIEEINNFFSREAKIIIYRIFQESLTNIGKHAQATCVSVIIKKQGSRVSFVVKDDGKGFDVEQVLGADSIERGLGLAAMDERAHMLGGSFYMRSQEGKGTEIIFTIPVDNKEGSR
jgi:PAS domain S-box-containing protein